MLAYAKIEYVRIRTYTYTWAVLELWSSLGLYAYLLLTQSTGHLTRYTGVCVCDITCLLVYANDRPIAYFVSCSAIVSDRRARGVFETAASCMSPVLSAARVGLRSYGKLKQSELGILNTFCLFCANDY